MTAKATLKAIEAKLRNDTHLKSSSPNKKEERQQWLATLSPEARARVLYAEELLFYLISVTEAEDLHVQQTDQS